MTNTVSISIERLDTGSLIYIRDHFNAAAPVLDIDFDGVDTYAITFGTDDWSDVTSVKAGETVEAYPHQLFLRAEKDISVEEHEAKIAAMNAQCAAMGADIVRLHAETAAIGAPALVAEVA